MTRHTAHNGNSAAAAPWLALSAWNGPMMAVFGQAGQACAKGCIELQQEVARFIGVRLEEDRRAQRSLIECRSFDDVAKLQQSWALGAAKAYAEEAGQLTQIVSRCAQQGIAPLLSAEQKPRQNGR